MPMFPFMSRAFAIANQKSKIEMSFFVWFIRIERNSFRWEGNVWQLLHLVRSLTCDRISTDLAQGCFQLPILGMAAEGDLPVGHDEDSTRDGVDPE